MKSRAVSRRLLGGAGAVGLLYGLASVFAWIQGFEPVVAAAILVGAGVVAALSSSAKHVRVGFAAGFIAALVAVWTQGIFLDAYFAHNPAYRTVDIPLGLSARVWTIGMAPVGALVGGALSAASAFIVRRGRSVLS